MNMDYPVNGETGEGPGHREEKKNYINCVMELVGGLWDACHCNRE